MTLPGSTITLIAISVILVVIVVAVFLVVLRRLRARRDQLRLELGTKPALVQDRAFNRLAMARREADHLARTGTDTSRALELIAQSQGAFDTHQYLRSYELAQSAHEALVNARGRATPSTAPLPPAAGTPYRAPSIPPPSPTDSPAPPPPTPLPRNRAESQFQLRLLDQEVATARSERPNQGGTLEAVKLHGEAKSAFDRGDFTEAFRLALRARRSLGGKVESLAAPPRASAPVTLPEPGTGPLDPAAAAEQTAAANRCPDCGYPTLPNDTFCRGCGTQRSTSSCPACGSPRGASDTFCGRCGAQFTP
ncbi:MAG TPA: zinc ribbon domain-containing protein [Thermoplasmata archaeon]|nr:zinc ribbon domain-containing protein [Thermoplasmata archaeon]